MATKKATKSSRKSGGGAKAAGIETISVQEALVDKALKKRWSDAMSRYRAALTGEAQGWDTRYEVLDEIISANPPYYLAGGYSTIGRFLKTEVPNESERTVKMAIRVARQFDPDDETRFGMTNLDALLSYLEAEAGGQLGRAKIHPERQKIRLGKGKAAKLVPFAEATRAQILTATRALLGKMGSSKAKVPPVVASLKKALAAAGLADVAVSMPDGKVAMSGIAPESFAALAKALRGVKGLTRASA